MIFIFYFQDMFCFYEISKLICSFLNNFSNTQERLDEMKRVSSSLTKVLGSNLALGMQQR